MNMRECVRAWSDRAARRAMPIMTYPGLPLAGLGILDVVADGAAQFECIRALAARYPSAAATTIMDLSAEAEAFGAPVRFAADEVPTVSSRIVSDRAGVDALAVPSPGAARTAAYLEAARRAAGAVADRPVFGGQIGPVSLAGRLFDMTDMMIALIEEPDTVHALLDKCAAFLAGYAAAYKRAGANGIVMAEPAAGLLSPAACDEFSSAYVRRIVEAVQDDSFMVILHNCGNTRRLVPSMLSTGAMGLHFGNAVALPDILPQIPADRIAFGNVDPSGVFLGAPAERVRQLTTDLLQATAAFPNYVLSSGCDVPPGTPPANVDAFFGALEAFNASR